MTTPFNIDSHLPAEMAHKAETVGTQKAQAPARYLLALAILAGAFIALGGMFATIAFSGSIPISAADGSQAFKAALPYGITRLLGGLVFSLGLILVVVGGAELFTGNVLIVMAWASRKVKTACLLRNWGFVYLGNFIGAVLTAGLVFLTNHYQNGSGSIGLTALTIANTKAGLSFLPAVISGILCNALVCLAVWLTYSARTTTDKILAILFPITAFVAAGFEHSVANMYFLPFGLFIKFYAPPAFWEMIGKTALDFPNINLGAFFLKNLLPVTIGNILGGGVLVAAVYWVAYLWKPKTK